jgi:protocatechuate 3,4-dioxygenase beta subunit/thiol-disulfide isomerase/thioredoxin
MNHSVLLTVLLFSLPAGLTFSSASPEIGNFDRKILNQDGSVATNTKVIVIHRNVERAEDEVITKGVTNEQGEFSGRVPIPEHWERFSVSTIVVGGGAQASFDCKYYHRDKTAEAYEDIILAESTTLKTRIIGADGKSIPGVRLKVEQIADSAPGGRIPFSQPVPALPEGLWSGVSDAEGRCAIDDVPKGLRFYLSHDDSSLAQPSGQMNIFVSKKTPMSDGDEYVILLTPPGSVSGRILLPDGSPARNAEFGISESDPYVTSYRTSTFTDDDGGFYIASVPPSKYKLRIGLVPPLETEWISAELAPVKIGGESPTVLPDFTLIKVAEVTANVVDADTRKVVDEPLVFRLPPGSHEVRYRSMRAPPKGYFDGEYEIKVEVVAGEKKQVTFELNPINASDMITGRVVDGDGKPAPDVSVALVGTGTWGISKPVKTDADGRFKIVQEYDLKRVSVVASNGIDSVSERIPAEPGDEVTLTLQKAGFAKIAGTVRDESGNAIRKADVRLFHKLLRSGWEADAIFGKLLVSPTQTDESGNFSFDAVWLGFQDYGIAASAEGFGSLSSEDLKSFDGTDGAVSLVLKSASESLTGTVVDAEGKPVAGAWVNCYGGGSSRGIQQIVTDSEGRFTIESLTPGRVSLEAGKYDAESSRKVSGRFQIPCDPVQLTLPVADGVVSGKVVDAEGNPAAGAEVSAYMMYRKSISDENGNFRITGLMAGWFEIKAAFEPEGQMKTVSEQRAKPGMENIILRLEPEKPEPKARPVEPLNLIGTPAPDIDVETWFNSEPHSAKAGGKVRILDFWGLRCAPCIATMPKIAKFWDAAPQDKLEIIALTSHYHDDEIREFLAKHSGYKFSFAKETEKSTSYTDYDIRGVPTYVVIAKNGMIVSYGHDWEKASATAMAEIKKE